MATVALSMRVTNAAGYEEPRDSISHDWILRCETWGLTPLLVPNRLADPVAYLTALNADILILTGGDDIGRNPERDDTETRLLDHALKTELPVLGVCRGMQLINDRFGGDTASLDGHAAVRHEVTVTPPLATLYGAAAEVNSYHDLGIAENRLAPDLSAAAVDADGHVEAFVHTAHAAAGVMWHPERDRPVEGDRKLIEALIESGAFWR